jgi:hypothetical protein
MDIIKTDLKSGKFPPQLGTSQDLKKKEKEIHHFFELFYYIH